jgi:hypothetical protein
MTRRSSPALAVAAVVGFLAIAPVQAAQVDAEQDAIARFEHSVDAYLALRNLAFRHLAPIEITRHPEKLLAAVDARAKAIQQVRGDARAGDIFDAEVGAIFRTRILQALAAYEMTADDVLAGRDEEVEACDPAVVNGRFSWKEAGLATPPCVLAVLPVLPVELQYRFVGVDMVLLDLDANLIVDVLPEALGLP